MKKNTLSPDPSVSSKILSLARCQLELWLHLRVQRASARHGGQVPLPLRAAEAWARPEGCTEGDGVGQEGGGGGQKDVKLRDRSVIFFDGIYLQGLSSSSTVLTLVGGAEEYFNSSESVFSALTSLPFHKTSRFLNNCLLSNIGSSKRA